MGVCLAERALKRTNERGKPATVQVPVFETGFVTRLYTLELFRAGGPLGLITVGASHMPTPNEFRDDDDDDESGEEEDAYAQADALLVEMKKFSMAASAAVSRIDKVEASNNDAANELHDRLRSTAARILADVVAGEPDPGGGDASIAAVEPSGAGELAYLPDEGDWVPSQPDLATTVATSSTLSSKSGRFGAAARAGSPRAARLDASGVSSVVGDISRLASRPLLGDNFGVGSRPGAPRRPAGFTSGNELGTLPAGRGSGRARLPRQ